MITLGQYYTLPILRITSIGAYLDADNLGDVLLPNQYLADDADIGDEVDVFLYLDSNDRPIATTKHPKVTVGQFGYLQVAEITDFGAFLDWGLDKDVLVPFAEQHRPMEQGQFYLVLLYIDKIDGRITASSKIDKFIDDDLPHGFKQGEPVDLIIANSTDLGFKAIVNHSHWGVLYKNEVFQRLSFGQSIQGFIKYVRPDGRIDLSLKANKDVREDNAETVLKVLQENDGFLAVHDKSDAKIISKIFGLSKGAFKKAIGGLYKKNIITLESNGIRLNQDIDSV